MTNIKKLKVRFSKIDLGRLALNIVKIHNYVIENELQIIFKNNYIEKYIYDNIKSQFIFLLFYK